MRWMVFLRLPRTIAGQPAQQARFGGQARIRTLEADGNRFTVCPLCPLGYLPMCVGDGLRESLFAAGGVESGLPSPRPAQQRANSTPTAFLPLRKGRIAAELGAHLA